VDRYLNTEAQRTQSFSFFKKRNSLCLRVSVLKYKKQEEMIRKLSSGGYRLYSRKKNPKTGKRRNLGTFKSRKAAEEHERAVQYFKHH
jgi:hypothetical protein